VARPGKIYTGPEVAFWRRLVLRRSGWLMGAFVFAGAYLVLSATTVRFRPSTLLGAVFCSLAVVFVAVIWIARERERLVRELPMPQFLKRKLRDTYPMLTQKDAELVERGLRQFFLACLRSDGEFVAMPSRVVDSMWHEFILHTRAYREWCDLVLGRFVDHVPAEAIGPKASTNDGLRRAWYWACRDEAIEPRSPSRLPLLFALDAKLAIANGFHYLPDCSKPLRVNAAGGSGAVYCGESFSDGSYSGDADGFGGSESRRSSHGGGARDGGGGGCGGSCGGGGD
jgi:hypothetical protein